jgi:tRNA threonylcarbamoyladenosine biosynthesis protein TsaE
MIAPCECCKVVVAISEVFDDMSTNVYLGDENATLDLGAELAQILRPGLKVYLSGELGSGKTTLVRGMLRALHYSGKVKSPTYTLVEFYEISRLYLYHFDLYRFKQSSEWEEAGFRELFNATNTCVVEWPENAGERMPRPDLALRLRIAAKTPLGRECLKSINLSGAATGRA